MSAFVYVHKGTRVDFSAANATAGGTEYTLKIGNTYPHVTLIFDQAAFVRLSGAIAAELHRFDPQRYATAERLIAHDVLTGKAGRL